MKYRVGDKIQLPSSLRSFGQFAVIKEIKNEKKLIVVPEKYSTPVEVGTDKVIHMKGEKK